MPLELHAHAFCRSLEASLHGFGAQGAMLQVCSCFAPCGCGVVQATACQHSIRLAQLQHQQQQQLAARLCMPLLLFTAADHRRWTAGHGGLGRCCACFWCCCCPSWCCGYRHWCDAVNVMLPCWWSQQTPDQFAAERSSILLISLCRQHSITCMGS
jgi:hypothetical protein